MIDEESINLKPLQDEDIPLFESWLRKDYIYNWFCPEGEEEFQSWLIEAKNRDSNPHFYHFMVYVNDKRIGFGILIDVFHEPDYLVEVYPDLVGKIADKEVLELGYCIGEETYLSIGLGKLIIKKLENESQKLGGKLLLSDPSEANIPSVKVLMANGFQKFKDGDYRKVLTIDE